jgi:predicted site-specific integrase-resolvase
MIPKDWDKVWVDEIINVAQASEIIGLNKRTVQKYIADGKIPAQRKTPNSPYYLNKADVIAFSNAKKILNSDPYAGEINSC